MQFVDLTKVHQHSLKLLKVGHTITLVQWAQLLFKSCKMTPKWPTRFKNFDTSNFSVSVRFLKKSLSKEFCFFPHTQRSIALGLSSRKSDVKYAEFHDICYSAAASTFELLTKDLFVLQYAVRCYRCGFQQSTSKKTTFKQFIFNK